MIGKILSDTEAGAIALAARSATPDEAAMLDDPTTCTRGFLFRCLALLSPAIGKEIRKTDEKLLARIKALEARPAMQYRGVWDAGDDYQPGDLVTDRGSMHYCWAEVRGQRPGETDAWQLCVKRGERGAGAP